MYRELDDHELLFMVEENQNYYDILLEKYKPLIMKISKKYLILGKRVGYELDDLLQIGYLGLLEAMKYFEDKRNVMFYTYIQRCIENKIKLELRSQLTFKRRTLNSTISLDETVAGTDKTIFDFLEDKRAINPYEELLMKEIEERYILFIQSLPIEVAVAFEMKNEGFSIKDIAKYLKTEPKDITRSLNFARQRICLN